jgi:hypothetical protein
MFIGDYEYGGCEIEGVKYAVVKNGGRIERIRRVEAGGNPVIWQQGDLPDDMFFRVIQNAKFTIGETK